jgi:uncharacterized membrane protein
VPGSDLGRIIFVSDAVFAFALTLLVLGLTVPGFNQNGLSTGQVSQRLGSALQSEWARFVGYVFAFAMIALWWTVHHRTFRYIQRYDYVLMWTNMMVLLEIAVMPFVLQVYAAFPGTQVAVVLFAFMQAVTGLTINLLWRYASKGHRLIDPRLPDAEIRLTADRGLLPSAAFAVSIGISFVSVPAAEAVWVVPLVLGFFAGAYRVS